jgi:hypothetical protein
MRFFQGGLDALTQAASQQEIAINDLNAAPYFLRAYGFCSLA